jgi:hypothetical protein
MMSNKLFDAPQIDSATIDYYLARGRRERARAFAEMVRSIFSSPGRRSAEVHTLAVREHAGTSPSTGRRAA